MATDNARAIGARIKAAREAAGMSREQLAKVGGVAGETLKGYETGHCTPTRERVASLCRALGVDVASVADLSTLRTSKVTKTLDAKEADRLREMRRSSGRAMRSARLARGMTITHAAAALGVAGGTVSHWEHGRMLPSRHHAALIFSVLGVELPDAAAPRGRSRVLDHEVDADGPQVRRGTRWVHNSRVVVAERDAFRGDRVVFRGLADDELRTMAVGAFTAKFRRVPT